MRPLQKEDSACRAHKVVTPLPLLGTFAQRDNHEKTALGGLKGLRLEMPVTPAGKSPTHEKINSLKRSRKPYSSGSPAGLPVCASKWNYCRISYTCRTHVKPQTLLHQTCRVGVLFCNKICPFIHSANGHNMCHEKYASYAKHIKYTCTC